jgi:hypothetical protein
MSDSLFWFVSFVVFHLLVAAPPWWVICGPAVMMEAIMIDYRKHPLIVARPPLFIFKVEVNCSLLE